MLHDRHLPERKRGREREHEGDRRCSRVWGRGCVQAICARSQRNTRNANKTRHMWEMPNMMWRQCEGEGLGVRERRLLKRRQRGRGQARGKTLAFVCSLRILTNCQAAHQFVQTLPQHPLSSTPPSSPPPPPVPPSCLKWGTPWVGAANQSQ